MIKEEALNWLSEKLQIESIQSIEKDLLLQGLLLHLSKSKYAFPNQYYRYIKQHLQEYVPGQPVLLSELISFELLYRRIFRNKKENILKPEATRQKTKL